MIKKSNYCRSSSRVRENFFYECNAFSNLCVYLFESYLDIKTSGRLDLDVFLLNASDNLRCYTKNNGKCCHFQSFEFARDLFAPFCSVFVRMYLNDTIDYFSGLFSRISLSDEKKIIEKIFRHALSMLNKFWDESNYKFFYEFFDMFDKVNSSVCYQNVTNKPEFGPYQCPYSTLSVIYF